jgi:hypothetical protein
MGTLSPIFDLETPPEDWLQYVRFDHLEEQEEVLQLVGSAESHASTAPFTLGNATRPLDRFQYVSDHIAVPYGVELPEWWLETFQAWFRHEQQLSPLETFILDDPWTSSWPYQHHQFPQPPETPVASARPLTPRDRLLRQIFQNVPANQAATTADAPSSFVTVNPAALTFPGDDSSPAESPFTDQVMDWTPEDVPEVSEFETDVELVRTEIAVLSINITTTQVMTAANTSDSGSENLSDSMYGYNQSTALYKCLTENCDYSSPNRNHMV